ncbi:Uncharacterized protein Fot_01984 [Forsythia ovata]|uniref:Gamma-tubulin complex component n=1 Tax=Forsythia ovata TaxID=205694 RepID=A0ABD1X6E4_9LAMI
MCLSPAISTKKEANFSSTPLSSPQPRFQRSPIPVATNRLRRSPHHQFRHKPLIVSSISSLHNTKSILGNNHIEDVRWLCSLSESELDFLMGLKTLIHQRAKKIGHEALVKKFDLRTLRALGFVLMENLKGQLKDLSATSGFECNLLNHNLNGSFSSMTIEDLIPYICSDRRKRIADMFFQDTPPNQKQKTGDGGCV